VGGRVFTFRSHKNAHCYPLDILKPELQRPNQQHSVQENVDKRGTPEQYIAPPRTGKSLMSEVSDAPMIEITPAAC
jgi:hypothetical protein